MTLRLKVKPLSVFGALEAASLGLGVAFVLLGTAWLLVNWWLHDGLHMVSGMDPTGLIWIEYGFHGTLIAAGAALAWCFATTDWDRSARRAAAP